MKQLHGPGNDGIERRNARRPRFPSIEHEEPLKLGVVVAESRAQALPQDIMTREYRVKFTGEICGGYAVDVERRDGTPVASNVKLRRWYEKLVEDGDVQIRLKLSLFYPAAIRVHVWGIMERPTTENVAGAICDLLNGSEVEKAESAYYLGKAAENGSWLPHVKPALTTALKSESYMVRSNAAWALAHIAKGGVDISSTISDLVDLLEDGYREVRTNAASALMRQSVSTKNEQGMEYLLNHPRSEVKEMAKKILHETDFFRPRY